MHPTEDDPALEQSFREHARAFATRAPLYRSLSEDVAGDAEIARLLLHAPAPQRLPVLFLAAAHKLLLDEPAHPLAQWYPNLSVPWRDPDDPELQPTFRNFVLERREQMVEILSTRRTQTNEVGRCALLVLAFGLLVDEVDGLAHLDVGASGGLNLLLDRYEYRFDPGGTIGGPSPVAIECGTRGEPPIPPEVPVPVARCGIDVAPVDVTSDDEAHWLEACVWPDQADRFHRLAAAIEIAREHPPELLAGHAVPSIGPAVERMSQRAHVVVTNSWVLNYFTPDDRRAYLDELDRIGASTDLSWVFLESPTFVPELADLLPTSDSDDLGQTELCLVRWRDGVRRSEHLGTCHPHGFWVHWRS